MAMSRRRPRQLDSCKGVDQASEALWHARMGHLNRGDLRVVLRRTGTPFCATGLLRVVDIHSHRLRFQGICMAMSRRRPRQLNVYFAPRVGMNLVSVPKLLRDRYSVVAHPQNVFVDIHSHRLRFQGICMAMSRRRPRQLDSLSGSFAQPGQRAEAVARPLLGGGAPAERLRATPRTDCGDCLG
jgi:hypothetical protein